jgi:hypothetical protein
VSPLTTMVLPKNPGALPGFHSGARHGQVPRLRIAVTLLCGARTVQVDDRRHRTGVGAGRGGEDRHGVALFASARRVERLITYLPFCRVGAVSHRLVRQHPGGLISPMSYCFIPNQEFRRVREISLGGPEAVTRVDIPALSHNPCLGLINAKPTHNQGDMTHSN